MLEHDEKYFAHIYCCCCLIRLSSFSFLSLGINVCVRIYGVCVCVCVKMMWKKGMKEKKFVTSFVEWMKSVAVLLKMFACAMCLLVPCHQNMIE